MKIEEPFYAVRVLRTYSTVIAFPSPRKKTSKKKETLLCECILCILRLLCTCRVLHTRMRAIPLTLVLANVFCWDRHASSSTSCANGLCTTGVLASDGKVCCSSSCGRCGGPGCSSLAKGLDALTCCPAEWTGNRTDKSEHRCRSATQEGCIMPGNAVACRQRRLDAASTEQQGHRVVVDRLCTCASPFSRVYRGACLPAFMIIGSQKAATSTLRWCAHHG